MARILVFIGLGIAVYLLIRRFSQVTHNSRSSRPTATGRDTVQCTLCKTYIPKDEAITQHERFFCCKQHARDWTPPGE